MTVSILPIVIGALFDTATAALNDVTVTDGWPVTTVADQDHLMIGIEDIEREGLAFSASSEREWAHVGGGVNNETGEVVCAAYSFGDSTPAARAKVYSIAERLDDVLRGNSDLGRRDVIDWITFGTSAQLSQAATDGGHEALLVFRVAFRGRV